MKLTSKWKTAATGMVLAATALPSFGQGNPDVSINITGTVTDSAGMPMPAASVIFENVGLATTTGSQGRFLLTSPATSLQNALPQAPIAAIRDGLMKLTLAEKSALTITAYGLQGEAMASM